VTLGARRKVGRGSESTDTWWRRKWGLVAVEKVDDIKTDASTACRRTLAREVNPRLASAGVSLVAIGIGTPERAKEFCDLTGYPATQLLADPENACYDALQLNRGAALTFLRPETPMALAKRAISGDTADLKEALGTWKAWIPPKLEQGLQQGGVFAFDGSRTIFQYYDPSTGAHADMDKVMEVVGCPSEQ
jgi:hypothetical protein